MAFEAILVPRTATVGWRRLIMLVSILVHGAALAAAAAQSLWHVEEMPLPAIEVTLTVAPPPPPPPPPPKRSNSHPKTKRVDQRPKVVAVPKETPKAEPEPEEKDEDEADDAGSDRGQPGGVPGGVEGSEGSGALLPPPKSTGPKALSAREGHGRLAIDPNKRPYRVEVPEEFVQRGESYSSLLEICVTDRGLVSSVTILEKSILAIDLQIPSKVKKWLYHPYLVDGQPTAFCYKVRYTVH